MRSMFGTMTNSSRHLAMKRMNSGFQCMPTRGVCCTSVRYLSHLVDLVGGEADQHRLAVELDLDDDDACVGRVRKLRHAEADPQVGERNDVAAHVDHAGNEGPRARDL